jgi:hypothetical protein
VEWTITLAGEVRSWDLAGDLLSEPLRANPHPDRYGNAGVWSFLDMADSRRGRRGAGALDALAGWDRIVEKARAGGVERKALEAAAREVQKAFTVADPRSPFWINRPEDEKALPAAARTTLERLGRELASLRSSQVPPVEFANGAQEGGVPGSPHAGVHDVRIHNRGRYDRLGEVVPRRFPEILAGARQAPITSGSGRLQLARWLTDGKNPLTARVMVNRIWQQHFGDGIVRTPSNFGKLGARPTHPECLDHLASAFVRGGWSVKRMHRLIMLSATYQQSSRPEPETLKADPDNQLFGRMNRRRLEAGGVRDSLLAVAGRLDRRMGGPAEESGWKA